jgi:hypothetical protein
MANILLLSVYDNGNQLQHLAIIDRLHVYHKINPSNTIIRTAGSYITLNSDKLLISWIRENWMFAGPYSDWGISGLIGRIAPVDYICPVDKIPTPSDPDGVIRVCSSPTRKEKGGAAFGRVMDKITAKYDHVEKVLISGVAWKEALRMKSTGSITFDLPVISVRDENALYSTLIDVIDNGELGRIGAEGKRYVTKYHHPKVVAKQWDRLIEHVQSM